MKNLRNAKPRHKKACEKEEASIPTKKPKLSLPAVQLDSLLNAHIYRLNNCIPVPAKI